MSASSVLEKEPAAVMMRGLSTDLSSDKRIRAPHPDLTYKIIGAAMRVHNSLGPGLKEAFYQPALTAELRKHGLGVVPEQPIEISIDGTYIRQLYIDHLMENVVIVEAKALSYLMTKEEIAQVLTYLFATHKPVGLLINFGRRSLEYKRILKPADSDIWKSRIRRYVWVPPTPKSVYPIRESADSNASPEVTA